ncbi:MAG: carboxymuconolactone decarboxylase family protein [Ilumatobacteraceae bacterium]
MTTNHAQPPTPRLAPISEPSPDVVDLYERAGLRSPDGGALNIFATLAHHPALLRRWLVFATHVLSKSTLTARDRELLILRVGVRCASRYEFAQHHLIAQRSDISVDEIERVKSGPDAGWTRHDAALLRAVDELHDQSVVSDETWSVLAETYGPEQLLDLLATVGNYHLVAFVLNSCGVAIDDGVPDTL